MKPVEHALLAGAALAVVISACGWYNHRLVRQRQSLDAQVASVQAEVAQLARSPEAREAEAVRRRIRQLDLYANLLTSAAPERARQEQVLVALVPVPLRKLELRDGVRWTAGPRARRALNGLGTLKKVPGGLELTVR